MVLAWGDRERLRRHEAAVLALAIGSAVGGGKDVTAKSIYKMVTGEDLPEGKTDETEAAAFFAKVDRELGAQ
jgi:hypothetical protein